MRLEPEVVDIDGKPALVAPAKCRCHIYLVSISHGGWGRCKECGEHPERVMP